MITGFVEGKCYIWDGTEINSNKIWFNDEMIKWYDRKPRKCLYVRGFNAKFEGIGDSKSYPDGWTYEKAMKYFKEYKVFKQEEFEV